MKKNASKPDERHAKQGNEKTASKPDKKQEKWGNEKTGILDRPFVRIVIFLCVLTLCAKWVSAPIATYIQSKKDLSQAELEHQTLQIEANLLNLQLKKWDDKDYIVSEARDRLGFVLPGEIALNVLDPETVKPQQDTPTQKTQSGEAGKYEHKTWYENIADSISKTDKQKTAEQIAAEKKAEQIAAEKKAE
jgi:cell division protein FtsB